MTKILNIDESYRLYRLVNPFYPKEIEGLQPVQLVSKILSKIKEINPIIYYRILSLLLDKPDEELDKIDAIDLLNSFIDGLSKNKIVTLVEFWNGFTRE